MLRYRAIANAPRLQQEEAPGRTAQLTLPALMVADQTAFARLEQLDVRTEQVGHHREQTKWTDTLEISLGHTELSV